MPTKRILIVDDEESIQTVVQFGIQMVADWDVLIASSGPQGIRASQVVAFCAPLRTDAQFEISSRLRPHLKP